MPKNIILLSDGTGNSASKLFKTNVWRLYQALDLSESGQTKKQIAYYDDGVGTASFKPLAILGGAFGWGLKRNVLDLYTALCRHYEPGDNIYCFGFSRGAFTIRVLIGLINNQGLVKPKGMGEGELRRLAGDFIDGPTTEVYRGSWRVDAVQPWWPFGSAEPRVPSPLKLRAALLGGELRLVALWDGRYQTGENLRRGIEMLAKEKEIGRLLKGVMAQLSA